MSGIPILWLASTKLMRTVGVAAALSMVVACGDDDGGSRPSTSEDGGAGGDDGDAGATAAGGAIDSGGAGAGGTAGAGAGGTAGTESGATGGTAGTAGTETGGTAGTESGGTAGTAGTESGGTAGTESGGTAGTESGGTAGTESGGTAGTESGGTAGTESGGTAGTESGGTAGTDSGGTGGTGGSPPLTGSITVSEPAGNTTEGGGTTTFTVVLDQQPTSNVFVFLKSDDTTEGTVGASQPKKLTFTTTNWASPQTVTATGQDDELADGDVEYTVSFTDVSSADSRFDNLVLSPVTLHNVDDESAGISISAVNATTNEAEGGAQGSFKIVLNSQPTANVKIDLESSNPAEGTLLTTTITFTPADWDSPRSVSVIGVDDDEADGPQDFDVLFDVSSADVGYDSFAVEPVTFTNIDNETAGVTVQQVSSTTTEQGGTATFKVVLNSEPVANVTFDLASSDETEGKVDKETLVFTPENWSSEQIVTVTGQNDSFKDGDQPYEVSFGIESEDEDYSALSPPDDLSFINIDDESAGFTVSAISRSTTEAGQTATFTVGVTSQPTAPVTVSLVSDDPSEGVTDKTELVFDSDNWQALQTVTVTGQDDDDIDADQVYEVDFGAAVSSDPNYAGLVPASVQITNIDDESAGFIVEALDNTTAEDGENSATVSIRLTSQPTSNVTVDFHVSDVSEGVINGPTSVTFTPANWNAAQDILVNGVDDPNADGDQSYSLLFSPAESADTFYDQLTPSSATLLNIDDETAGFTIEPLSGNTSEQGAQVVVRLKLNTPPLAPVTVHFKSSDTSEGRVTITSLTFTAADWDSTKTITVTGRDDLAKDGDVAYRLTFTATTSDDPSYAAIKPPDVNLVNLDFGDTPGYILSPVSGNTTESGGQATFTVRLTSQPLAVVRINVSSSDLTEGTVSPAQLVFGSNWATPQVVTITGQDDSIVDGTQQYPIVFGAAVSNDLNYKNMLIPSFTLLNVDNDTAGFIVSPISGDTTEDGGPAMFSVRLTSQPLGNVTVPIASSETNEGDVDKASLVFTNSNWQTDQIVTVTGQDDEVADGNQSYSILLGPATSPDGNYNNRALSPLALLNIDNDSAGFILSVPDDATSEDGDTAEFSLRLTSEPTGNVTLNFFSDNPYEGTVAVNSVTFTTTDWADPHYVLVTGTQDGDIDGDTQYYIVFDSVTSSDTVYGSLLPETNVLLHNVDDDTGI